MFRSCIDVLVVRVKVSRVIVSFYPMGIDSADTSQTPNGENCMDKSHFFQITQIGSSTVTPLYQKSRLYVILGKPISSSFLL